MLHQPLPSKTESSQPPCVVVQVWDLPVRIFHWALVILLVMAVVSAKIGGNAMDTHLQAGYCITVLLIFRIVWGFIGSPHARFTSFLRGIRGVLAYGRMLIRGQVHIQCGHNPLGGWMVVALLLVLAIQAGTGLFSNDDIMAEGPLAAMVGKDMSDYLSVIHKLDFKLLAAFSGLHVLAIAYYRVVKRINLVLPMITGRVAVAPDQAASCPPISRYTNLIALALLLAVAIGIRLLVPAT